MSHEKPVQGNDFYRTTIAGDGKGLILAYAMQPKECSWSWKRLIRCHRDGFRLSDKEILVLISDRKKGFGQAIQAEILVIFTQSHILH